MRGSRAAFMDQLNAKLGAKPPTLGRPPSNPNIAASSPSSSSQDTKTPTLTHVTRVSYSPLLSFSIHGADNAKLLVSGSCRKVRETFSEGHFADVDGRCGTCDSMVFWTREYWVQ